MIQDLLIALLKANLAASALVLLVLVARKPAQRAFGARTAYGLWLAPILGALAVLVPARASDATPPASTAAASGDFVNFADAVLTRLPQQMALDPWSLIFWLWIAGAVASLVHVGWRQAQYLDQARQGRAGPAVVGVLRPKIVVPANFSERFTARERDVMLAHEDMHIARGDALITALAVAIRSLNWFNPLAHIAVDRFRIDQELACDAHVLGTGSTSAKVYAETMVKAQLVAQPLPLGCAWPAGSQHPLTERVALIVAARPNRLRARYGAALIAMAGVGSSALAWAAQPPSIVPAPSRSSSLPAQISLADPQPAGPDQTGPSAAAPVSQVQHTPALRSATDGAARTDNATFTRTTPYSASSRDAVVNEVLGLPADARPNVTCDVVGPFLEERCEYRLKGGPSFTVDPALVPRLAELGVDGGPPTTMLGRTMIPVRAGTAPRGAASAVGGRPGAAPIGRAVAPASGIASRTPSDSG